MKKRSRLILSLFIILLTIAEFSYYLSKHSYLLRQFVHMPPLTILWIFLLYTGVFGALALILHASLRICGVSMNAQKNLLLNAYSLFVNFFMIGQAGPGVRAAYLKKYYKLLIRKYIYVTLVYYACYAIISGWLILIGSTLPWWIDAPIIVLAAGAIVLAVNFYTRRKKLISGGLNWGSYNLLYLFLATLLQTILQITIYWVELHAVNGHISLKQTMAYTGVANFALFVGLTPGAIGIRESFLVFSERLHHITSANIISANIIDRSVYLIFLLVLFVVTISFHVKGRLSLKEAASSDDTNT